MKTLITVVLLCGLFTGFTAFKDKPAGHVCNSVMLLFNMNAKKAAVNAGDYHKVNIVYKGQRLTAYQSNNGWFGFFKQITVQELPVNAISNIHLRYGDYKAAGALMFMSKNGDIMYFTKLTHNNKCLILVSNASGEVGTLYPKGISMTFD